LRDEKRSSRSPFDARRNLLWEGRDIICMDRATTTIPAFRNLFFPQFVFLSIFGVLCVVLDIKKEKKTVNKVPSSHHHGKAKKKEEEEKNVDPIDKTGNAFCCLSYVR